MSKGYIDEQKQLKSDLAVLEEALYGKKQMLSSMRQFADLVERYTDIRDVSSELLHTLIDRIVIHEKEMEGDEIIMRVDVYYRFIGYVGDKTGDDMKAPQIRHRRWGKKNELVYEEGENPENE